EHVTAGSVSELLDVQRALTLLRQAEATSPDEMLRQLAKFHLLQPAADGRGTSTNLGAILFPQRLEDFGGAYGRKAPRVVFYKGDNRVRTDYEQAGTKGYAIAFEGMASFIESRLPR